MDMVQVADFMDLVAASLICGGAFMCYTLSVMWPIDDQPVSRTKKVIYGVSLPIVVCILKFFVFDSIVG